MLPVPSVKTALFCFIYVLWKDSIYGTILLTSIGTDTIIFIYSDVVVIGVGKNERHDPSVELACIIIVRYKYDNLVLVPLTKRLFFDSLQPAITSEL